MDDGTNRLSDGGPCLVDGEVGIKLEGGFVRSEHALICRRVANVD